MNITPLAIFEVFGRLHPVMLHMPIGLVGALAGIEGWRLISRNPAAPHAPRVLGVLAALAAVATALMGLALSQEPAYASDTVELHERLGLAFAGCAVVVGVLLHRVHSFAKTAPGARGLAGRRASYLIALSVTLGVMVLAGHFGGEITHGEGFITDPLTRKPRTTRAPTPPRVAPAATLPAGDEVPPNVQAVFDTACISCHGAAKHNGGLRLDHSAALWEGADAGPVIVRGDIDASELTWRMTLPPHDEDHMPPENKPQPTAEQVEAVVAWVKSLKPLGGQ